MTFLNYNHAQYGGGLHVFRGSAMQRGYGLGGIFKSLSRTIAPTLKKGLKSVGKQALKTGLNVLQDFSEGKNIRDSLKRRANENLQELVSSSIPFKKIKTNPVRKAVIPRKCVKRKQQQNRKKKKVIKDIFT